MIIKYNADIDISAIKINLKRLKDGSRDEKKNIVIRWLVYYAIIMFIIIFGAYGRGYVPVDPIYANF